MKTAQAIAGHTIIHPESMYIFLAPDCAVWIMVEVNVTYMLTPLQQYKMFMMFMNTSTGGEGQGGAVPRDLHHHGRGSEDGSKASSNINPEDTMLSL